MSGTTVTHALDGLDFQGTSRSYTTLPRSTGSWPSCERCGSTLYPERFESSGVRTIGGSRLTVDVFRCKCGKGRSGPPAAGGRRCLTEHRTRARVASAFTTAHLRRRVRYGVAAGGLPRTKGCGGSQT